MDIFEQVNLLECPICAGPALLEEENDWCFYVCCLDCGCHTAEIAYNGERGRLEAARKVADLWNEGKVIKSTPGE